MTSAILGLIPTMQSIALASSNISLVNKKNKKPEDFIKQSMKNIVGIKLMKETSNFI